MSKKKTWREMNKENFAKVKQDWIELWDWMKTPKYMFLWIPFALMMFLGFLASLGDPPAEKPGPVVIQNTDYKKSGYSTSTEVEQRIDPVEILQFALAAEEQARYQRREADRRKSSPPRVNMSPVQRQPVMRQNPKAPTCDQCNGTGRGKIVCSSCSGTGLSGSWACTQCNGDRFGKCSKCYGTGTSYW